MNLPQVSATTTICIASHGILWLLACNQLKLLTTHSLGSSPYLTPEVTELLKNKKNGFRVVVSQDDLRVVVAAAACGSPHPPESQERTRTLSLSLSSSVFLPLPESSFSAAVLQGNPKDPTVLYRSPTRVPEGPNRPLKQAYKGIRRTPLVHCSSPSGNPKEPCIVCSTALRGVWKTSSIPLQQPYKGNLKDPEWEFQASSKSLVPFSSTKESLNLGTIWRKGHT